MRKNILSFFLCPLFLNSLSAKAGATGTTDELREAREYEKALEQLDAENGPLIDRARLLLDLDRIDEALRIYNRLCDAQPTAICYHEAGIALMVKGDYQAALENLTKAEQFDDAPAAVYSNLALACLYTGDVDAAESWHRRALSQGGTEARVNYGIYLYRRGQHSEAAALFTSLLKTEKDLFYAHLYLGKIFADARLFPQAMNEFNRGIRINDTFFDLYFERSRLKYRLNDGKGAWEDFSKAKLLMPRNRKLAELQRILERK